MVSKPNDCAVYNYTLTCGDWAQMKILVSVSHKRQTCTYNRYKRQHIPIMGEWVRSHCYLSHVARGELESKPSQDTQVSTEVQRDEEH